MNVNWSLLVGHVVEFCVFADIPFNSFINFWKDVESPIIFLDLSLFSSISFCLNISQCCFWCITWWIYPFIIVQHPLLSTFFALSSNLLLIWLLLCFFN